MRQKDQGEGILRTDIHNYRYRIVPSPKNLVVMVIAKVLFATETDFNKYTEPTALWYFSKI